MRGFIGGLILGTGVVAAGLVMVSLTSPPQRPIVSVDAPQPAAGPDETGGADSFGLPANVVDADLVELAPTAPETADTGADDLSALSSDDTQPSQMPRVGGATSDLTQPGQAVATAGIDAGQDIPVSPGAPGAAPAPPDAGAGPVIAENTARPEVQDLPRSGIGGSAPVAEDAPQVSVGTDPAHYQGDAQALTVPMPETQPSVGAPALRPAAPEVASTGSGLDSGPPTEESTPEIAVGSDSVPQTGDPQMVTAPSDETRPMMVSTSAQPVLVDGSGSGLATTPTEDAPVDEIAALADPARDGLVPGVVTGQSQAGTLPDADATSAVVPVPETSGPSPSVTPRAATESGVMPTPDVEPRAPREPSVAQSPAAPQNPSIQENPTPVLQAEPEQTEPVPTETVSTEPVPAEPVPAEPAATEPDPETPDQGGVKIAALPQAGNDTAPLRPTIGTRVVPLTERNKPATAPAEPAAQSDPGPNADGPAIEAFAAAFENPDDLPMMAIVLIDDAASIGVEALRDFPYPLTFAVDPSLPDAAARMAAHRKAGFEVVVLIDLPQAASAQDAEVAMSVLLQAVPEAVAVLEGTKGGIQGNRGLSDQVTAIVGDAGMGLITQSKGLNTVSKLAARDGVPAAPVFRDFDGAGQSARVMRRFLDQAAFRAGQKGAVIMLGRIRPDTISALLLWGLQDRASRVALAPVSAALMQSQ